MSSFRSFFLLTSFCCLLLPQSIAQDKLASELRTQIEQGLSFLEHNQTKATVEGVRYAGEWPTIMCIERGFVLLGESRCLEDSNCFSVASIHNALAQIYLKFPEYDNILPMLDKAFAKMISYKNGKAFNFWNLLPPTRNLKRGIVPDPQPLVRRPTNFDLFSIFINNAANVVEDADDTALAYTAMAFRNKILNISGLDETHHFPTDSLGHMLDQYRDHHRKNRHWFNVLMGNEHDTGAYLTWLGQEYKFKRWNFLFDLIHDVLFYLPFSECYPKPYVPYIPYGSNNIDAVVNSNILSALAINGIKDSKGRIAVLRYLEKNSKKKRYRHVGSYYPNSYHFPYALSEAYANGEKDLERSVRNICKNLLRQQEEDGSWTSMRFLNRGDKIQSTAYALNALINFGKFEARKTKSAITAAINYLISTSIEDQNGLRWKGGVFFSGGTVVRNNLIWKSDAFTTVLIIKAFSNYLATLPSHATSYKKQN